MAAYILLYFYYKWSGKMPFGEGKARVFFSLPFVASLLMHIIVILVISRYFTAPRERAKFCFTEAVIFGLSCQDDKIKWHNIYKDGYSLSQGK